MILPEDRVVGQQWKDRGSDENDRDDFDAGDVEIVRVGADGAADAIGDRRMEVDPRGELRKSLVDEVIPDVADSAMDARVRVTEARCLARKVKRILRYLDFRAIGVAGNVCHLGPVSLARLKVRSLVGSRRILV